MCRALIKVPTVCWALIHCFQGSPGPGPMELAVRWQCPHLQVATVPGSGAGLGAGEGQRAALGGAGGAVLSGAWWTSKPPPGPCLTIRFSQLGQ